MTKSELKRLIKIEDRIYQIAKEDLNLDFYPIEFDIIPPQKMFEIMSYNIPTNISKGFSMRLKSEINVFLVKAQNAIAETDTLLLISYELGYINQKDLDIFSLKTDNINAQINGLIIKFERELIEENNQ